MAASTRDALNPQILEISKEFLEFPDFDFISPEWTKKSEILRFLTRESPEWTGITQKRAIQTCFVLVCVKNACLRPSASRKEDASNEVLL